MFNRKKIERLERTIDRLEDETDRISDLKRVIDNLRDRHRNHVEQTDKDIAELRKDTYTDYRVKDTGHYYIVQKWSGGCGGGFWQWDGSGCGAKNPPKYKTKKEAQDVIDRLRKQ